MSEKFSFLKLLSSPMNGLFWVKTIMFGFGIGFIAFVSYGVYKAYFKKPPDTQAQVVSIGSLQAGSTINFGQESSEDGGWFDPFMEVFVEGDHGVYGPEELREWQGRAGIRIGLRF